ncbi:hypothetical protein [Pseudooceanicola nitratireducens]|uniref:hypothetical protein n=1 Tax=Pseudooceanicola nitratireducens TaxID=517719 RepID=UPI003C79A305
MEIPVVPKQTLLVAELDQNKQVAAVWIKKSIEAMRVATLECAQSIDLREADFVGAPEHEIVAWLGALAKP